MPEHAFLTSHGDSWTCDRGFKRTKKGCEPIQVPDHARLNSYGNGWTCEPGFKREGNRCKS